MTTPNKNKTNHCIVIIPTYNEIGNIEKMISTIFSIYPQFHLLIIDDGSPDSTAQKVIELQNMYPKALHLIKREGKMGLGTAYTTGFKWALRYEYDYIFEMDCDFSHNPIDLAHLYNACYKEGADMAIGSRYIKGGKVHNWPLSRILLSYFASLYVRCITWIGIKDTTAGFVCYSRKVLETIDLGDIQFVGYAFQIEMKLKAKIAGFRIKEIPITFVDRQYGESKMHEGIIKEAIFGVLKLQKDRLQKKIFGN